MKYLHEQEVIAINDLIIHKYSSSEPNAQADSDENDYVRL